jgi:transposase
MNSVIVRINDLIDEHGKSYTKCRDPYCIICAQIRILGEKLWSEEKGEQKKVAEPFEKRMTKERYLELKRSGYTDKTIASEYGVSIPTIAKWKKKHFTEAEKKAIRESKQNDKKQQEDNKTIQLEQEIERLKREVIDAHKLVAEKDKKISEMNRIIKSLTGQVAAQESQFVDETLAKDKLQRENESLKIEIEELRRKVKDLEYEKERYFVDFMALKQEVKGLRLYSFEKLKKDVYGA